MDLSSVQPQLRAVRPVPARIALVFGVLLIIGNLAVIVYLLLQSGGQSFLTGLSNTNTGVVMAVPLDAHRTLVATITNDVLLQQDGRTVYHAHFSEPVGGMAVSTHASTVIAIGTADGVITEMDDTLQPLRHVQVNGRVVGLQSAPDGGFYAGYGSGAYSTNYVIAYFAAGANHATFTTPVNATISTMDAQGQQIVYGTTSSQVGSVDGASGKIRWSATLSQPITTLLVLPDHQVLAGDNSGNVFLINAQGQPVWQQNASAYTIRSLAFDAAGKRFLAGDANGQLFAMDSDGNLLVTQSVATSDVQQLLPEPDGTFTLIPRDGSWAMLHPAVLAAIELQNTVRPFWIGFNILVLGGLIIAIIYAVPAFYKRTATLLLGMKRGRLAYLLCLPALAAIVLFNYYPTIMAFYYSLTDFSLQNVTQFVGLQNYSDIIFRDDYFRAGMVNMLLLVITSVLKTVTLPLLAAELVFWTRNHVHRYIFRTLFVLPAVVPGLILTFMWRMVYDPNSGLLNQVLTVIGLGQWQHAWLGEQATSLWAIIGVGFPFISAFPFLIYLGGLLNISSELYEAANIDGVNWFTRFLRIDVPLLVPQFRVLLFFVLAGTVQSFVDIFVLTKGGPGIATDVPALQMYFNLSDGHFGYASAIGMVLFIIIIIPTIFVLRYRKE